MVVIVNRFREWRHFLIGSPQPRVVNRGDKNLKYFNITSIVNRKKAPYAEIPSEFNFKIVYHPGKESRKAHAISCWVDFELEGERGKQELTIWMFKPLQLNPGDSE